MFGQYAYSAHFHLKDVRMKPIALHTLTEKTENRNQSPRSDFSEHLIKTQ